MIIFEENIRNENIKDIAKMLMTAARTAPKARGVDNMVLAVATDEAIVDIANKMRQLAVEREMEFFSRDADNIMNSGAIVLFGMKISAKKILYPLYRNNVKFYIWRNIWND